MSKEQFWVVRKEGKYIGLDHDGEVKLYDQLRDAVHFYKQLNAYDFMSKCERAYLVRVEMVTFVEDLNVVPGQRMLF